MNIRRLLTTGIVIATIALAFLWLKFHSREIAFYKISLTRIDFYGKVVDEHGQPIPGASTSYIVSTMSLSGSPTLSGPKTDSAGRFEITGKRGPSLSVKVEHPNYYKTDLDHNQFTYAEDLLATDSPKIPTADNPAIFVLHSKGKSEPLIRKSIKTHLPMDGTPVSVDLAKGSIGSSSDSVVLVLHSDGDKLPLNQYYPFDWSLKIQVPGGGIQERTDRFQFQAPTEGYHSEVSYSQTASLLRSEWKESLGKEFFILLPSGIYARIQVNMLAVKGACRIESFLNPHSGSQNLEYNASQQVTAQ
jgi:hypothetical protein